MNTTCLKVAYKISFCMSVVYEIQASKYLELARDFKPKFLVVCVQYLQYTSEIHLENNIKSCLCIWSVAYWFGCIQRKNTWRIDLKNKEQLFVKMKAINHWNKWSQEVDDLHHPSFQFSNRYFARREAVTSVFGLCCRADQTIGNFCLQSLSP